MRKLAWRTESQELAAAGQHLLAAAFDDDDDRYWDGVYGLGEVMGVLAAARQLTSMPKPSV